jgi:hypothetical protein
MASGRAFLPLSDLFMHRCTHDFPLKTKKLHTLPTEQPGYEALATINHRMREIFTRQIHRDCKRVFFVSSKLCVTFGNHPHNHSLFAVGANPCTSAAVA